VIIQEILTVPSNQELDEVLAKCCELVLNGQELDSDFYGLVGACVVFPNGNKVYGVSYHDDTTGRVVHAERAALDRCDGVDANCVMVTTLSPCNERHDKTAAERYGESCEDLIAHSGIQHVYCGYKDFTQDHSDSIETRNAKLKQLCKQLADTFLKETPKKPITEYRDRMYQYIKSMVPAWPDYVVKDWLYANFARGNVQTANWSFDTLGEDLPKILANAGLTVNTKWQLVPDMKFTMDMWEPLTLKRLKERAGGSSKSTDPDVHIPARDAERHATQAALAQQQGGIRKEPVLLIKTAKGYELLEGWHRTIQHFVKYPEGYTGPAYVATAGAVQENFADGRVKGKSRPGRVKRAGASCSGSVTDLRRKAKNSSGERARMYHWCANMKSGKKK
jgi:pyrimidine deaminase RibD-like protein